MWAMGGRKPMRLTVADAPLDGSGDDAVAREVLVEPEERDVGDTPRLGITPIENKVKAVRGMAAELGLAAEDRLISVADRWIYAAEDLRRALYAANAPATLVADRDGERVELVLPLWPEPEREAFLRDIALEADVEGRRIRVLAGEAAADAGLLTGDEITSVDGEPVASFTDLRLFVLDAGARGLSVELGLNRRGAVGEPGGGGSLMQLLATPEARPLPAFGLRPRAAKYVFQAKSPLAAASVGLESSWRLIKDSWRMLKGILGRDVSGENVGGIITIGAVSYEFAQSGMVKLFFFLCMLSVNLAFLNVLPIPVLDGGHLLFLIIEKIQGEPVSERVLGYSQLVGIVLILSLMVYVTFNDIVRVLG